MTTAISVDPYILTCAVRYALTHGGSGLAELICDEVEASWADLGSQQKIILREVQAVMHLPLSHRDYLVWQDLLDWIDHHG